ncbi:hypothetical protein CERZMDRAFT_84322 [Cercospora zeae-maydis SCOH1-5]|uniref:Uncharacterized protein n=1 Tax=Cercospora zeae-maydis SCOH1-5 TaxID=717836 RepID=A0A6A6FH15_9PEZI|nr:hypothetical protein CERZMDRAFT_84322 [Cercospora zeae-maydis SCOH1-5]
MGRRRYLERLALGRSAYQDIEAEQPLGHAGLSNSIPAQEETGREYEQQYDSRGRPINPTIEEFNAEQRKAQNAVLALVGIVEKKEEIEQSSGLRYKAIQEARRSLLRDEQDRGEVLEYVVYAANFLFHLWPDAFIQRVQIGLYDSSRSVAEILSTEWAEMYRGGMRWSLAKRFPGGVASVVHALTRVGLMVGAEYVIGELQDWAMRSKLSRKSRERLHKGLEHVLQGLIAGICVVLMPLEYYAAAQRLDLAPALPTLPGFQSFLPTQYAGSFHRHIWNGRPGSRLMGLVTSPGAFLFIYRMLFYDATDSVFPVFHLITDFTFPDVNDDPLKISRPKFHRDPVGWVLYQCYILRSRFLQRSGWFVVKRNENRALRDIEEANIRPVSAGKVIPIHRSTVLAQLPIQFLADAVDGLLCRIINLPFEALMMRTIAANFLASSHEKTIVGIMSASRLYAPLLGGPFSRGGSGLGQYMSRTGLSLALSLTLDVVIFHGIYNSVRRTGVRYFDWGRMGKIGQVIYSEEGFTAHGSRGDELDHLH